MKDLLSKINILALKNKNCYEVCVEKMYITYKIIKLHIKY